MTGGLAILRNHQTTRSAKAIVVSMLLPLLAACAESDPSRGFVHDPYEAANRKMHEANKALDSAIVNPAAKFYAQAAPAGLRTMISNASGNLSAPRYAINHLLQGDVPGFFSTVGRFVLNTTLGLGGLADPASETGLYERPADFGQTLGVWGVKEGAYVELPVLGPSSERATAGRIVDFLMDPVNTFTAPPETYYISIAAALDSLGARSDFDAAITAVLYDSEDSYAAGRLLYLQSVRGAGGGATILDDLEDPYAE